RYGDWAEASAADWPAAARLKALVQPALVLAPRVPGAEGAAAVLRQLRAGSLEELADLGPGFLAEAPAALARRLQRFLGR
ncbi:MAG: hypothetical protein JSR54_19965, partial [Proteobacteria bacterium]|nr:hypothetical protein [Pseudomonadota bacterium]